MKYYRNTDNLIEPNLVDQVYSKYQELFGEDGFEYVATWDMRDDDPDDWRIGMLMLAFSDDYEKAKASIEEIAAMVGVDPPVGFSERIDDSGKKIVDWVQPINEVSPMESTWSTK